MKQKELERDIKHIKAVSERNEEQNLEEKLSLLFEGMTLNQLFRTQRVLGKAIESRVQ